MNKIIVLTSKLFRNDIFVTAFGNYGEILFRLFSKFFLVFLSLYVNSELFGALVLVLVVDAIASNIFRYGQDRRLLLLHENNEIPIKQYLPIVLLTFLLFLIIVYHAYKMSYLLYILPVSLISTVYFLVNVRNRILDIDLYNKRRISELVLRFIIAPIGLYWSIDVYIFMLFSSYLILILCCQQSVYELFSFSNTSSKSFWRYSIFGAHSALAFLLAGLDKLLITAYLGIVAQGEYSQIFSLISVVSIIYLFLSFIYEPKYYNSNDVFKVEKTYLKTCYLLTIPFGILIFILSYYFNILEETQFPIFGLLFLLFIIYPLEFSKIYIQTRLKGMNKIVISSVVQVLIILLYSLMTPEFSILSMVLVLIFAKLVGIIILKVNE